MNIVEFPRAGWRPREGGGEMTTSHDGVGHCLMVGRLLTPEEYFRRTQACGKRRGGRGAGPMMRPLATDEIKSP